MSTLATPIYSSPGFLSPSSRSSNEEMANLLRGEEARLTLPITWQRKWAVIDSVIDVFRKHHNPNWDGYGAVPLSESACKEAASFLKKLPLSVPNPDVIPNPDGDISLEWYLRKRLLFVVTFSGRGIISYAGLFGKRTKIHGTEVFSESIPSSVLESLCRLLSQG